MKINNKIITFEASNIHQGHYILIDGKHTGKVVNLFAYNTINEYKNKVNKEIKELCKN